MPQLAELTALINAKIEDAKAKNDSGSYIALTGFLKDVQKECRESIQALTSSQIEAIIKKLKKNDSLTGEDLAVVRLWLVGDAETYVNVENNFADWSDELNRLQSEIQSFTSRPLDVGTISSLHALLIDLDRTVQDMIMFLQDKERVQNFERATRQIDSQERQTLIEILTRRLQSPQM